MPNLLGTTVPALPPDLDPALRRRAEAGATWLRTQKSAGQTVTVVHHIDADGVSSAAIAASALDRAGIPRLMFPVKSLDAVHIAKIDESKPQALWFCDLGSTAYMHFPATPRLVCDHHQLVRDGNEESFAHVNPLLDGGDGETVSGAGCAYLVAASLDNANLPLLPLALVGAAADLQDRKQRKFHGTNDALLCHGVAAGLLETEMDLGFFGPETRPLRKYLSLASEPAVPGLSRDRRGVEQMFLQLGIPLTDDEGERTWSRLSRDERRTVRSLIVSRLLDSGLAPEVDRLWRQVVRITGEPTGSPTRELQEFGTLLNSTARYGRAEVGLAVAMGDRALGYAEALDLLLDHRKHLANALDVLARQRVTERLAIQHVHLRDQVRDTVVGIVCGMALDGLGLRRDLVMVGLAWTDDGRSKASARAPNELQARGIDLSVAMRDAAAAFGGQGGGHKGAAGATIPREAEASFLALLDATVAAQIGVARVAPTLAAAPRAADAVPVPAPATAVQSPALPAAPAATVPGRGAQTRFTF